jgi:hypothetical protein
MKVKKQKLAQALSEQMRALGITSQTQYITLLRQQGIDVSQPTLSRLLRGDYAKAPPSLTAVCNYSAITLNNYVIKVNPARSAKLMDALRNAWDGTPQSEAFLAQVIKAAGRMGQSELQRTKSA